MIDTFSRVLPTFSFIVKEVTSVKNGQTRHSALPVLSNHKLDNRS